VSIKPGPHRIDPNASQHQFSGQHLCERTHGSLRSRVNTQVETGRPAGDGGEHDRAAIPNKTSQALRREERALRVNIELSVERGLGDLIERREFRDAGINEQSVDVTELLLDERAQRLDVRKASRV
jgi:hypothetical protein